MKVMLNTAIGTKTKPALAISVEIYSALGWKSVHFLKVIIAISKPIKKLKKISKPTALPKPFW